MCELLLLLLLIILTLSPLCKSWKPLIGKVPCSPQTNFQKHSPNLKWHSDGEKIPKDKTSRLNIICFSLLIIICVVHQLLLFRLFFSFIVSFNICRSMERVCYASCITATIFVTFNVMIVCFMTLWPVTGRKNDPIRYTENDIKARTFYFWFLIMNSLVNMKSKWEKRRRKKTTKAKRNEMKWKY